VLPYGLTLWSKTKSGYFLTPFTISLIESFEFPGRRVGLHGGYFYSIRNVTLFAVAGASQTAVPMIHRHFGFEQRGYAKGAPRFPGKPLYCLGSI